MPKQPTVALDYDWTGELCFLCATGPSFTEEVAARVNAAKAADPEHVHVITVNDAYLRVDDPDIVYACDWRWWQLHLKKGVGLLSDSKFDGRRVSASPNNMPSWAKIQRIPGSSRPQQNVRGRKHQTFMRGKWTVTWAGSSGFQAANLALHTGADPIVMCGYDCRFDADKEAHFFGRHPSGFSNPTLHSLSTLALHFAAAAGDWPEAAARFRLGTPSAIDCFEPWQWEQDA